MLNAGSPSNNQYKCASKYDCRCPTIRDTQVAGIGQRDLIKLRTQESGVENTLLGKKRAPGQHNTLAETQAIG